MSLDGAVLARWIERAWQVLQAPGIRLPLGVAAALAYIAVLAWPFSWHPPDIVANGARLGVDGTSLQFPSAGLVRTARPPAWLASAMESGRLEISFRARPLRAEQAGSAPLLSLARNGFERNLAISQRGDDLILSLRTPPAPGGDGCRDGIEPLVRLDDAFRAGEWLDVELMITPGDLRLRVDGEREIRRELADAPLRSWSQSHRLAFGNEVTGSRPWLGELDRITVRTGGARYDYPQQAALERPQTLWVMTREPKLHPFRYLEARDVVNNLVLYAPLGFFLGVSRSAGTWRAAIAALFLIGALSAGLELVQLFVSVRNPSINDVIFNVVGGGAGFASARWLAARVRPRPAHP